MHSKETENFSKWDRIMERSPWRCCWASCWPWLWSHEGMEEGTSWWVTSPLSLEICQVWYWAVNDLSTQVFKCRLCTQTASTTKLNFTRNWKIKLKCSWTFICTMMLVFHIVFKLKRGRGKGMFRSSLSQPRWTAQSILCDKNLSKFGSLYTVLLELKITKIHFCEKVCYVYCYLQLIRGKGSMNPSPNKIKL